MRRVQVLKEPSPPIVLHIESHTDDLEYILENGFTKHLFPNIHPRIIEVEVPKWLFWVDALSELQEHKPDLSEEELEAWRKGPEFAALAIDCLLDKAKEAAEGVLDRDVVRVIILRYQCDLTRETEEAIKGSFPNAFICDSEGDEVTHLQSMPISELKLNTSVLKALQGRRVRHGSYVSWLAARNEAEVLEIEGIGKSGLQNIKEALAEHGVELRQE